jgi:hypothetical protein
MKPADSAFQPFPYPSREVLTCGVLQPIYFIQIMMVEHLSDRLERFGDFGIIDEPACLWIDLAAHGHFASEGVTVKPEALMLSRHIWQAMS